MADRLRMTVAGLRSRMSGAEFQQWAIWHAIKAQKAELEQLKAKARGGKA